jgi:hypothetical protein
MPKKEAPRDDLAKDLEETADKLPFLEFSKDGDLLSGHTSKSASERVVRRFLAQHTEASERSARRSR